LIEILVAIAILAMMMAFFTQMIGNVSKVTGSTGQRLSADAADRMALDIMANDLASRIKRPDVGFYVLNYTNNNDEFYFYSEAPATSGVTNADTVALIGYKIVPGTNATNGLQRMAWGWPMPSNALGEGMSFYPPDPTIILRFSSDRASCIQPLSKEVVRMEVEFMKKDGTFVVSPPMRSDSHKSDYSYVTSSNTVGQIPASQVPDWDDIRAMVVTIACIDRERQALLSADDIEKITSALTDATSGPNSSIASGWGNVAENANFTVNNKAAAGAVRIYRRFFPINEP